MGIARIVSIVIRISTRVIIIIIMSRLVTIAVECATKVRTAQEEFGLEEQPPGCSLVVCGNSPPLNSG